MENNSSQINFPEDEYTSLQQQFDHFGFAYTIRVSDEKDKYEIGNVLETPWGRRVRVSEITLHNSINTYPFVNELTEKQKNEINQYDSFVAIKLDYI